MQLLVEMGLTVEQAFDTLIEQAENERERQVLAALRGEVMAGSTIARALGAQTLPHGRRAPSGVRQCAGWRGAQRSPAPLGRRFSDGS